jgi:hypothetical protein
VKAIVEEARSVGLPVTAHVTDESMMLEVLAAGVSGVEHGPNAPLDSDALARALKNPERSLVPTLATLAARTTPSLQLRSRTIADLHKAGVRIVVGTDTRLQKPPGLRPCKRLSSWSKRDCLQKPHSRPPRPSRRGISGWRKRSARSRPA